MRRVANRPAREREAYARLLHAKPEQRQQAYDDWLQYCTPREARVWWRHWMPAFPGWAEKPPSCERP